MTDEPSFPPLLSGHCAGDGASAFDAAVAAAKTGAAGAGDVFWSPREDVLQVSVVLEPDCNEPQALQMLFVTMVAFADSFGALGPPEVGIFYQWPNDFRVTGASLGRARIGVSANSKDGVPDWLVAGIEVRMQPHQSEVEPGFELLRTSIWDEGGSDLDPVLLIEAFARHFLTWVHTWGEDGFKPVYNAWIGRALGHKENCEIKWQDATHKGEFLSIDEGGQLLLKEKKGTVALGLEPVVERG